jgi:hypothetical protein
LLFPGGLRLNAALHFRDLAASLVQHTGAVGSVAHKTGARGCYGAFGRAAMMRRASVHALQ